MTRRIDEERERSLRDPEGFWAEAARAVELASPFTKVLDSTRPEYPRWFQGATLGVGEPLIVQVDPSILRGKSPFKIRWLDFRNGDDWLKANWGTFFFLKVDGDYPELLLNSAHSDFRAILEADPKQGINAALQKLMNLGIAQVAWMQLFQAAVARAPGVTSASDGVSTLAMCW